MKVIAAIAACLILLSVSLSEIGQPNFCDATPATGVAVDIPMQWRQMNWTDRQGHGSCVHASMIMLLRWQGHHELAAWWRKTYAGGDTWSEFTPKCDAAKLQWAGTYCKYDVAFLEWAIRTRRGCMVTVHLAAHMILLVGLDETSAYLLDNNTPDKIITVPRDEFLTDWKTSYSWALTPCYNAPTPVLRSVQ